MKAIRLYEYGAADVLRYETDAPEPAMAPDMVLIEVSATSVNPIDWKIRSGTRRHDFPLELPAILGKDVSGTVRAVGGEVTGFAAGDRVIARADATYAQLAAVPAAIVTHLPDGLDPIDAAAIPLVSLTGEQLVRLATQAAPGQTILVTGALGSVGRAAVHAARKLGATVIAGVRRRQLDEAAGLGAAQVVALDDDDAMAGLAAVDGVADTVGGGTGVACLGKVKPGGRFGYASALPQGAAEDHPEVTVSRVFARPDPATLRAFAEDVRDGAFALPISQRMALGDAAAAHERLERGGGGKIVLMP